MTIEYSSHNAAQTAAHEASIKNPGIGWYVSVIEDDAYTISIYEDYQSQNYWMNGKRMYPDTE